MMSLEPLSDHDLIEIADLAESQWLDDSADDNQPCGVKVKTTYRDHDVVAFFDATLTDQIAAYSEAKNWWAECGESAFRNVMPSGE